jgi:ATP-citrate lyase beta-subunit
MAKVLEGPGMGLMKKWGITVPNYVVVTSVDELTKLGQANEWLKKSKLVVKAHEALGSRFKLGLVKVDLDLKGAEAATKEMVGRRVGSITVSQVIVSEMIPHKEEYYCAVKSTRAGTDILVANCGGIEVESNWERVKRLALEVGQQPSADALEKLAAIDERKVRVVELRYFGGLSIDETAEATGCSPMTSPSSPSPVPPDEPPSPGG